MINSRIEIGYIDPLTIDVITIYIGTINGNPLIAVISACVCRLDSRYALIIFQTKRCFVSFSNFRTVFIHDVKCCKYFHAVIMPERRQTTHKKKAFWENEREIILTHMWQECHSHKCLGMKGLKSAVPTFGILAVNLRSLLVSKCHPCVSSFCIWYAWEATQFSSIAHCKKYNCRSSKCIVLIISS